MQLTAAEKRRSRQIWARGFIAAALGIVLGHMLRAGVKARKPESE